ncbi:MAG: hypothetical protein HOP96_01865, partial [Sphingomonas sp.]|nr:hypothetical protein [Sphingomonas sp.]
MDFPYLEKVTKLNVAALAAIASAPPPPEPKVEGAVSTDTTISFPRVAQASRYFVRWRRTDSNQWQESFEVNWRSVPLGNGCYTAPVATVGVPEADFVCDVVLKGVRVDDWVFGVSSVSADGFESPVASAVQGGAFKPWVAPPPEPVK